MTFMLDQREFCPPLDSSLLAALTHDLEYDHDGSSAKPTQEQINALREQLALIARDADTEAAQMLSEVTSDDPIIEGLSNSTPSFSYSFETASSTSEASQTYSFETPLGFLQAALPGVSTYKLRRSLMEAEYDPDSGEDVDIWPIVNSILSEEFIRELEERGLEEALPEDNVRSWRTVEHQKPRKKTGRQKAPTVEKFSFGDLRQRQAQANVVVVQEALDSVIDDPWTQLSSLASHLSTLLPSRSEAFFLPYFHRPKHKTPYDAVCAALRDVTSPPLSGEWPDYGPTLITILDILLPTYGDVSSERLVLESETALRATQGRGEDALEIVKVLRDLDTSSDIGFRHQDVSELASSLSPSNVSISRLTSNETNSPFSSTVRASSLPAYPPSPQTPPASGAPTRKRPISNTGQWQKVQNQRRKDDSGFSPLPPRMPTYTKDVNGTKVPDVRLAGVTSGGGGGNLRGQGGKGELGELQKRAKECLQRRNEMLREASKMWQRGKGRGKKGYAGGEVAMYFAEKVREILLDIERLSLR